MGIPVVVRDEALPDLTRCAAPLSPVPRRELRLAAVLAASSVQGIDAAAPLMGISRETARMYLKSLAPKLPGDIPSDFARVRVWARGASLAILGVKP